MLPARQREFLGDRVTADDRFSLEDRDLKAGLSQVASYDEGILGKADDDDVTLGRSDIY